MLKLWQMHKIADKSLAPGILAVVVFSLLLVCLFFVPAVFGEETEELTDEEKEELEEKQDDLEDDISNVQKKLDKEKADRQKLEGELNQIQYFVNSARQEIIKTQTHISETEENIARYESEIKMLEERNEFQKRILAGVVRQMYYAQSSSIEITAFKSDKGGQFLGDNDKYSSIEKKILLLMDEIKISKSEMEEKKFELQGERSEYEKLLGLKEDQQKDLLSEKQSAQSDIAQKDATIGELNAKLSKLRSNLSGLLGKSYDAKDIEDAAKFASKVSGVRKDFIMGMLVVESDLGRFTGGCYAKDSRMSGRRLELFKEICKELDYEWKKRKVSCPPKSYTGTGGAMGVAQFMSDTWMGYKSQITSVTGHNPPDPWNLTDGVVAMGLKLARGGATKKSGECNAAKLYLSGTTSSKYDWYCQKVKYWADNYERLLD